MRLRAAVRAERRTLPFADRRGINCGAADRSSAKFGDGFGQEFGGPFSP
jgi:hypothetical protein